MHQRSVAFALEAIQQPANMPLALADLLGGLPLRDQAFLRCRNPSSSVPFRSGAPKPRIHIPTG